MDPQGLARDIDRGGHTATLTAADLIAFEDDVGNAMAQGFVKQPTHLCGGNEDQLIEIFKDVKPDDWLFCSYRNHYHALLYGVPRAEVMAQILAGRSMTPHYPGRRFFSSAIVGGCLPIAVGVAEALKRRDAYERVWCFVGDMGAMTGAFHEATIYAAGHGLPVTFVVEDNGLACDTPTREVWGHGEPDVIRYAYERVRPHLGAAA